MERDGEGFLSPIVNQVLCIECGLCSRICPVDNPTYANSAKPRCFAIMAPDMLRLESSSGAVFPVLAEKILAEGGVICGAAFREDWSVGHIIVDDRAGLEKLKGSKYVQSDLGNCFTQVKDLLEDGRKVLFSGTPCQVAGLKAFLRKDFENLQTVDIICHGVPSPGVWEDWLKENFDIPSISDICFRNKKKGWSGAENILVKYDSSTHKKSNDDSESYIDAFLKGRSLRRSCGQCLFNRLPRQGDLTLGDFWGVRKMKKSLDDGKGTSVVLENSSKGNAMLEAVRSSFKSFEERSLKDGLKSNVNISHSSIIPPDRSLFFQLCASKGASAALRFFNRDVSDCKIVNFWFSANYGANLTCWALQESLFELGYSAKVVNYMPEKKRMRWYGSFAEEFAQKRLHLTKPVENYAALAELNDNTDTFIVGSDQVFRPEFAQSSGGPVYTLDFSAPSKKRIAASASFGTLKFNGSENSREAFARSLKTFSAVSVREQAGVEICRGMGVEAEQILEPVFWMKAERWHELADEDLVEQKGGIFYFSLPYKGASRHPKVVEYLNGALGLTLNRQKFSKLRSVEEWLDSIRKADFVVTDSFHGTCFALIFHRPFAVLSTYGDMSSRMDQVLGLLGLRERIIHPDQQEGLEELLKPIDWDAVDAVLASERERALAWISAALAAPAPLADEAAHEAFLARHKETASEQDAKRKKEIRRLRWNIVRKFIIAACKSNIGPRVKRRRYRNQYKYYKALLKKAFR